MIPSSLFSRVRSTSLRSAPLATMMIAALTVLGCGGGGGGGTGGEAGVGGAAGAHTGGTNGGGGAKGGSGGSSTGGAAGGSETGTGGAAGGTATGAGGAAGSSATGTGGAAGGSATGTGGAAGGSATGTGGAAGGSATGTGGSGGVKGTGGMAGAAGSGATCTEGASCTLTNNVHGVCTSGTCQGCTADNSCSATGAYGAGFICLQGTGDCVQGICHNNGDCSGKICNASHTCAACTTAATCTTAYGTGYICQTATGKCVQGTCGSNADCSNGGICNGSATCVSCGTSDAACVTSYGTGFICVSGGCVTGTCHSGANCTTTPGQICNASHTCASCTDDTGCQASYTDGRICVANVCVVGTCHDNSGCSNGQVCVGNACVNCANDTQCSTGQICLPSGACTAGNCHLAGDCNDTTKVCAANTCSGCTTSSDCTGAYGNNHVCNGGSCTAGNCVTTTDCAASGLICGSQAAFNCGPCAVDGDCSTAYGAGHICNGGVCITGACHSSANCGAGQVCDLSSHTCTGCGSGASGDTTCQGDTKYGSTYICQGNACIVGNCHTAATCNNTAQVCNSFACGMCSTTADCTTAYGANHVCTGGACVSGNCNVAADCGTAGQVCVSHACVACTAGPTGDAQCVNQVGPMEICLNGGCVAGNCHDTSSDCMAGSGQICGIAAPHTCGSCGTGNTGDNACKGDTTYGSGDICLGGACTQGDCHDTSTDCTAGKICGVSSAHTCGNCSAGSTGDTQCTGDARYMGDICFQGLCGAGNCHATSSDCTAANAGLICGVSAANTCGSCTSDSQCKSDAFYGSNDICNTTTGKCVSAACMPNSSSCSANGTDFCCSASCVTGNCCADVDCGAFGTACVGHTCSACNAASGNKWYVDPVNGNDATATGSDLSGGTVAPGCAFKTITRAIAVMPATPTAGSQIIIVGTVGSTTGLSAGDTLPIILPTNTTLTTTGGPVTITLATPGVNNPAGFRLNNNGSGISGGTGAPLVLDGSNHAANGGIAIQVSPGTATFTSNVSNVTIQNTTGDGIRVTAGTLTVGAGVVVSNSVNDGIHITGGTANINNPSGTQTLFTGNAQHGIEVQTLGSVNVVGTPAAQPQNGGTVVSNLNTQAGIRINQTPGGVGLVTNSIKGLVSWANTNYGMRLFGGSLVKVRNSTFLGNGQYGVIVSSGANTIAGNDVSNLDMGKPSDPGKNYLQTPLGGLGTNASGGLCVALTACTAPCLGPLTENVSAEGNQMVSSAGNLQVDCSTSTSAITKGTCGGLRSDGINAAANITTTVDVAGCM
jgi:hypothetical protein